MTLPINYTLQAPSQSLPLILNPKAPRTPQIWQHIICETPYPAHLMLFTAVPMRPGLKSRVIFFVAVMPHPCRCHGGRGEHRVMRNRCQPAWGSRARVWGVGLGGRPASELVCFLSSFLPSLCPVTWPCEIGASPISAHPIPY